MSDLRETPLPSEQIVRTNEINTTKQERLTVSSDWSQQITTQQEQVTTEFEGWSQNSQITGVHIPYLRRIAIQRLMPDLVSAPSFDDLRNSEERAIKREKTADGAHRMRIPEVVKSAKEAIGEYLPGKGYADLVDKIEFMYNRGSGAGQTFPFHDQSLVFVGQFPEKTVTTTVHEAIHLIPGSGFVSEVLNEGMTDYIMQKALKTVRGSYPEGTELLNWLIAKARTQTGIQGYDGIFQQAFLSGKLEYVDNFLTKDVRELIEVNSALDIFSIIKTEPLLSNHRQLEAVFIKLLVNNKNNTQLINKLKTHTLNGSLGRNIQLVLNNIDQLRFNPPRFISRKNKFSDTEMEKVLENGLSELLEAA